MRIPKRYGESKRDPCPFCKKQALTSNSEGVPVCIDHKSTTLPELKCMCGSYLTQLKGKFGIFFNCMKCGNVGQSRVFEINDLSSFSTKVTSYRTDSEKQIKNSGRRQSRTVERREPSEIIVRADDPFYCG